MMVKYGRKRKIPNSPVKKKKLRKLSLFHTYCTAANNSPLDLIFAWWRNANTKQYICSDGKKSIHWSVLRAKRAIKGEHCRWTQQMNEWVEIETASAKTLLYNRNVCVPPLHLRFQAISTSRFSIPFLRFTMFINRCDPSCIRMTAAEQKNDVFFFHECKPFRQTYKPNTFKSFRWLHYY